MPALLSLIPIVLLLTTPISSFSFFSLENKHPEAVPWVTDSGSTDDLAKALSHAFPSRMHQDPAYSSAMTIFRSLESKPSCHRIAAASLVNNCSSLDEKSEDGGLKIAYAVQLAVCELEATGVGFPQECNGLQEPGKRNERKKNLKCVQKLEERPQWWTTLSNNIQNAVVMCSAVRHELEKDQLLKLHRNITKVQQSLFTVLDTSLDEAWRSLALQKNFAGDWRKVLDEAVRDLVVTNGEFTKSLRDVELRVREALEKLLTEIQTASLNGRNAAAQLEKSISESRDEVVSIKHLASDFWDEIEKNADRVARTNSDVLMQNSELIQQTNEILSTEIATAINDLLGVVQLLSAKIEFSVTNLEQFETRSKSYTDLFSSLSNSYTSLAQAQVNLSASLEEQEMKQNELLSLFEKAQATANKTLEYTLMMTAQISESLIEADTKIKSWGTGQSWSPVVIFILGFGVLMGKEGAKHFVGVVGIAVGGFLILTTNVNITYLREKFSIFRFLRPDFRRVLELNSLSTTRREAVIGDHGEPLPAQLVFGICGIFIFAIVLLVIAVRNMHEPANEKSLLPTEEPEIDTGA
ncbi:hypothetical protein RUND412_000799 [Rhizina undulata]